MELPITCITAGILGILFFIHSVRTIKGRTATGTNLGDGGNDLMIRRIRIHGNFAEYIPLLLLMMLVLELAEVPTYALVAMSASIILGRIFHFYGLYSKETPGVARVLGMQLTLWPLMLASMYLLVLGIGS